MFPYVELNGDFRLSGQTHSRKQSWEDDFSGKFRGCRKNVFPKKAGGRWTQSDFSVPLAEGQSESPQGSPVSEARAPIVEHHSLFRLALQHRRAAWKRRP